MNALDPLKREAAALSRDGRGKIIAAIGGSTFLFVGVQMMYPVLLPNLRTAYGLDLTTAGLLLTVLWTTNAVCQLPGGYLVDRFGERIVMTASAAVAAGIVLVVVSASSVSVLFVATALVGVMVAVNTIGRYAALVAYYPDKLGGANGAVLAAADGGQAVLPPIASLLAAAVAWQVGFGFSIPLFLLVALWLWLALPSVRANPDAGPRPDRPSTGPSDEGSTDEPSDSGPATGPSNAGRTEEGGGPIATVRAVLSTMRQPHVGYGTAMLFVYFTVWILFTGFYPSYLVEVKGLAATTVSGLFGLFFAMGIVVKPIAGGAYDRAGLKGTLPVLVGIPGVTIGVLPLLEGTLPFVLATVVIAPVLGSGTVVMSYLIENIPAEIRGTGFGTVRTLTLLLAGLSPIAFGAAADRGRFDEGMVLLALLALVIIPLTVRIPALGDDGSPPG